jgi:hypothetical protein
VVTFVSVPPCANVTIDWKVASGVPVWQSWALTCKTHAPWICCARELGDCCPDAPPEIATRPVVSAIVPASTESRARLRTERWIFESMFNPPLWAAFPGARAPAWRRFRAWQTRKRAKKGRIGFQSKGGVESGHQERVACLTKTM